ncbi:Indolepyruvate oxidoreductase subunit IorA [hydrothermal vent metagenome]|uniref:Indolepyruvate oxidoreductase subunit IorA n=1 Tax=hydrothermal vent metagenome TaxID=652676 RepID=A0A3B0U958_9ZZZZ
MQKFLLLGAEAIGQGAVDGGISGVYAYPGTPSTEITEYIQSNTLAKERNIHTRWSANEKTAYEAALGMSYAGKRAIACMKHVGLNVAADAFINSAITGINGGLILAVADDPSMHSSQNEQDSRFYGKFAMIPVLEPSNQQEAYEMAREGLQLSEDTGLPVMVRITTRLSHSRADIELRPPIAENPLKLPQNLKQFMLLPVFARKYYASLLEKQGRLGRLSETSKYNVYIDGEDKSLGIICCGIAYNYLNENYIHEECPYPVIKLSQYPLPGKMIRRMEGECDEILVLEEGYPLVEEMLKGFFGKGVKVKGRLDGTIPRTGELNPGHVAKALAKMSSEGYPAPGILVNRPPSLCQGCGHQDVFFALNEVLTGFGDGKVFSDIGCYTLGALPPYESINTCVDMGASITMAKGAADAGLWPVFSVIGDSTFTHSGITGLLDAVNGQANVNIIILDNEAIAMTGGQDSAAEGKLEAICKGVGVEEGHITTVVPVHKNHQHIVGIIKEEVAYQGVSVIIARRPCIQKLAREKKIKRQLQK